MCRCQAAGWTKSSKAIYKMNFHPILLATACLRFAGAVVIPTFKNVTISGSPNRWFCWLGTSGSSPYLQEYLVSPTEWNASSGHTEGGLSWAGFQPLAALQACALVKIRVPKELWHTLDCFPSWTAERQDSQQAGPTWDMQIQYSLLDLES